MSESKSQSQELATVSQSTSPVSVYDQIHDPLAFVVNMGKQLTECGMFGRLNQAQGQVLAWHMIMKRRDPLEIRREFHIFEDGSMSMRSDSMLAKFRALGGKFRLTTELMDCDKASGVFVTPEGDEYKMSVTFDDVKDYALGANGIKKNWKASRPDMLRARLISKTLKVIAPEVVAGTVTPEEVELERSIEDDQKSARSLFGSVPKVEQRQPVEVAAEVVTTQAAQVSASEKVTVVDGAPSDVDTQRHDIRQGLKDIEEGDFVLFLRAKRMMTEQQGALSELDASQVDRLHKNLDQCVSLYRGWAKAKSIRDKVAAK